LNQNMTSRIGALALVMISAAGATAQAATVTRYKLHDRSLQGGLEYADECTVVTTFVRFAESVTQTDGVLDVSQPLTQLEVDYSNGCTGESFSLTGGTTVQTVHFASDLSSATLQAVITVSDVDTGLSATVPLNLVWTANGPLQEAKDKTRSRVGNTITVDKYDYKLRPADLSGTAPTTLPSTVPLSINLVAFSTGGAIGKDVFGERTVTKK
jgi:hypothetical protein